MRKVCITLCLCLFASLIHAATMPMPVNLAGQSPIEHVLKHDCHTASDVTSEDSKSSNHQTLHQCCLGAVVNLSSNQNIQRNVSNHFISLVPQLIVEAVPSHIFKPPKQIC